MVTSTVTPDSLSGYTLGKLREYNLVRYVERAPANNGAYVIIDLVPLHNGKRTNRRYMVLFVLDDTRTTPCEQTRIGSARTLNDARAVIDAACDPITSLLSA